MAHWTDLLLLRLPLALWVGATFLVMIEAPVVFTRIASRETAGDVFGAVLARMEAVEHVLSVAIVFGVFSAVSREGRIAGRAAVTAVTAFLAIAANVYASMVVRPRMRYYRAQAGSFDFAPEDDPWRRRFRAAHRRATAVTAAGFVCALAALLFAP